MVHRCGTQLRALCVIVVLLTGLGAGRASADWVGAGGDPARTGVTADGLDFPLRPAWAYEAAQPPAPAFTNSILRGRRIHTVSTEPAAYDWAFQPVVAGGRLFFGSSSEEKLFCLDASSGATLWTFPAEGPIRFAPVYQNGRLYFCSDDGVVYCLAADSGAALWQTRIAPESGKAVINGRPVSAWPVRGGLTVHEGVVYCSAGIFPVQGVYVAALRAEDGSKVWCRRSPYAAHGQALVVEDKLWLPTHKTAPVEYSLEDGSPPEVTGWQGLPTQRGLGGAQTWKVDGLPAYGPNESGVVLLRLSGEYMDFEGRDVKAGLGGDPNFQLPQGIFSALVGFTARANSQAFVLVGPERILAVDIEDFRRMVDRRAREVLEQRGKNMRDIQGWRVPVGMDVRDHRTAKLLEENAIWQKSIALEDRFRTAIIAGDALVCGGKGKVMALNVADGSRLWTAQVEGVAHALAADDGALFVSTDEGRIYCFRHGVSSPKVHRPPQNGIPSDTADEELAATALRHADRRTGQCLVLGAGDGGLVKEIIRGSEFFVVVVERDAERAMALRERLHRAGLYGSRAVVRHEPDGLDYPPGFANLIVCGTGDAPYPPEEVLPLGQPYGGTIVLASDGTNLDPEAWSGHQMGGWWRIETASGMVCQAAHRGAPPGAGDWPMANGNPANTMCSGESRVDNGPLRLQWFGRPYAADIADRHAVPQPPLYHRGILLLPGRKNTLTGIDAYNGTIMWKINQPESLRLVASHNSSPIAFGQGCTVFAISGSICWELDALTGQKLRTWEGVLPHHDRGYVGAKDSVLVGSSQGREVAPLASREVREWQISPYLDRFKSRPSVSGDVFAFDTQTGERLWTRSEGLILNTSITLGDGRLYALESTNKAARENTSGMMELREFLEEDDTGNARVVALDLRTGRELWQQNVSPEDGSPYQWIFYLACADGVVLSTQTGTRFKDEKPYQGYEFTAFEAKTGSTIWTKWIPAAEPGQYTPLKYAKNAMSARPIIVGDRIYLFTNNGKKRIVNYASVYDLFTGEQLIELVPLGNHDKGCSVAIASNHALYFRDWMHVARSLALEPDDETYELTGVTRPSCWPSTLPVGGLILAPEGSAYCSCGYPYQVSFALAPAKDGARSDAAAEK